MPNLVFAGTSVAYGGGKAVVFATAMDTQFGKIAELTQSVEAELSPLQKEMSKVIQLVAILATGLGVVFFLLGYFVGGLTLIEGFVFAVGIIVATFPRGCCRRSASRWPWASSGWPGATRSSRSSRRSRRSGAPRSSAPTRPAR